MVVALVLLVTGTLFLTALCTPLVFSLLLQFFPTFPWPFSRVFDRVAMVWILLLLWMLRRQLSVKGVIHYFKDDSVRTNLIRVAIGFLCSSLSVIAILPVVVDGVGVRWADLGTTLVVIKLLRVIPAAILISVIEESFFRGLLLEKIKSRLPFFFASVVCSLLYGFAHFITPSKSFAYHDFAPLAGFSYMFEVFERMLEPGLLPAFLGLFMVGMVLCYVIQFTQSLYLCIGLHAGWVAALKIAKFSTAVQPELILPGAGMRYFLVAQPSAWVSIVLVFCVIARMRRVLRVQTKSPTEAL